MRIGRVLNLAGLSSIDLLTLLLLGTCMWLTGCLQPQVARSLVPPPLEGNDLVGDLAPVRDPSIAFENGHYFVYSTDPPWASERTGYIPIRCSSDHITWSLCGHVFKTIPAWIHTALPHTTHLWAPDISFFGGRYYLYYCASTLGSQNSVIGVATNTTLDASDAAYRWVDHGQVLKSKRGDDFNAIDPSILVLPSGIFLTYGSFWSGIKQQRVRSDNGMLFSPEGSHSDLAAIGGGSQQVVEGASILHHGRFFYLFISAGLCCEGDIDRNDYRELVGRSRGPRGPYVDVLGRALLDGGGTLIARANSTWAAPGGGTAFHDPSTGADLLVLHALRRKDRGVPTLLIRAITWKREWPTLSATQNTSVKPAS